MRRVEAILAVAAALALSGCVLRGKQPVAAVAPAPKPVVVPAPPPPPPVLSLPQTTVQLPPPQPPVNPDALATVPAEEPAEAPQPAKPPKRTPARTDPTTTPQTTVPPPPVEQERPIIQEILPAAEQKQLLDRAASKRLQVRQILEQTRNQHLNDAQRSVKTSIETFVKASEDAEKRNDARGADVHAERALVLARELQGAK
jgi:hypothetical protein